MALSVKHHELGWGAAHLSVSSVPTRSQLNIFIFMIQGNNMLCLQVSQGIPYFIHKNIDLALAETQVYNKNLLD